jgi:hypothetical protein
MFFLCGLALVFLLVMVSSITAQTIYHPATQPNPQGTRFEIPPGWTVFQGQGGLIVTHPTGWQVQERGGGAFLTYRLGPGGVATALAMAAPMPKIEGQALGVVQEVGQIFPDLFPQVKIIKSRLLSSNPEVALAEMQYAPQGLPFKGLVMCFKKDNRGVLYTIAASTSTWIRDEPVMKQILSRFFYSGEAGPGGGGTSPLPQMVLWNDLKEGAFSCPVPAGWQVEGGVTRLAPLDKRLEIMVVSPDRKALVRIGDVFVPSFSAPGPLMQFAGVSEGMWHSPDGMHRVLVMRYLPGTVFLAQYYLPQRVGQVTNVRTRTYPEIAQRIQAQRSQVLPIQVDVGDVTFDAQTEMGPRKGYAGVQTVMSPVPGYPNDAVWWVEFLAGYLAAPEAESAAEAVLQKMVAGFQMNPAWVQQQAAQAGEISGIWSRHHNEISDMMHQGNMNRTRIRDGFEDRRARANRGGVLIEDPGTGQRYEVPGGSNYYWRSGSGNEFIGTETSSPDLPLHWMQQMKTID